jgi:hypothetical protein
LITSITVVVNQDDLLEKCRSGTVDDGLFVDMEFKMNKKFFNDKNGLKFKKNNKWKKAAIFPFFFTCTVLASVEKASLWKTMITAVGSNWSADG